MNKKKIEKIALIVVPIILFILIILAVFQFTENSKEIDIPNEKKEPVSIKFENNSAMDEVEISEIVESKRKELQTFFTSLKYYNLSDVADGYTKEDDKNYFVLGESSLIRLRELLTLDAYSIYYDELTEIAPKSNIIVEERLYLGKSDLFTSLFTNSAIATEGVNEERQYLRYATNEVIEAIQNIKYCESNTYDICQRDDKFALVLIYEDNDWKIDEFTKIIK